jgi:hypothetical protein
MLESLPTWIETAKRLLRPPSEPDERLPSEHTVGLYALRGYRGHEILVSTQPYPGAYPLDAFLLKHAKATATQKRFSDDIVRRDVEGLEETAHAHDAVRVVPCL